MMQARILSIDIETAPAIAYVWGMWKNNIGLNQLIQKTFTLSWAAKWLGEKEIMFDGIWEYDLFDKDPTDDWAVVESMWQLMNKADIIIAHNGDNFDIPHLQRGFIEHGLGPVHPLKSIDTLKVARKHAKFLSNRLDYISQTLGLGKKIAHEGFELWIKVMAGEPKACAMMKKYNIEDVRLLEEIYLELRPYIGGHPNVNLYGAMEREACNKCGSPNVVKNGTVKTPVSVFQGYHCKDCGAWPRGRTNLLTKEQRGNILTNAVTV